jgi:serine/threonine-protein kinase
MMPGLGLEPGTHVAGWEIIRAIRTGGFGAVHRAEQAGKDFAIKVALHREESGDIGKTHARAVREVVLLMTLDHPNIIKSRGHGYLPDGRLYCVLPYVDGWTLGEWKERKHPTFREIARVIAKVSGAVAYMHEEGVIHRDLKLANVMIDKNGEPVIIDLGCATYRNAPELTTTPGPPGTRRYRSPEHQAHLDNPGRNRDAPYTYKVTDELFAVGVMLYELLTEPLPTKNSSRPDFADPLRVLPSAREVNPRVPEALSALVDDLLARDPAQRPEDFEALRRRLVELAQLPEPEYALEAHPPSTQRQPPPVQGAQAPALAAPGNEGRRGVLALADKQAPRVRGRLHPRALVGLFAASGQRWRKPLALAGIVAAVVLAAGAAAWLARGEYPAPALQPASGEASVPAVAGSGSVLPPVNSSPVSSPPPAPAQDRAPVAAPATAPKEGSTVKPKPSDVLKSSRPAGAPKAAPALAEPGTPAWCKAVALFVALGHPGCASVPLKAEPFECPPGAVEAMEKLGWDIGRDRFAVRIDERGPSFGHYVFTVGAPVTGRVPDSAYGPGQKNAVPGTLFHGRIYVTEKEEGAPLGLLVAIYDRVEIPNVGKFPVCVVTELLNPVLELKDGTAKAMANARVNPVERWAP